MSTFGSDEAPRLAEQKARISSLVSNASMNRTSAPASANAAVLHRASCAQSEILEVVSAKCGSIAAYMVCWAYQLHMENLSCEGWCHPALAGIARDSLVMSTRTPEDSILASHAAIGTTLSRGLLTSNDSAWRASVRATMTMLDALSSLASTAALILATASPRDTTFLPLTWPQDLGAACISPAITWKALARA